MFHTVKPDQLVSLFSEMSTLVMGLEWDFTVNFMSPEAAALDGRAPDEMVGKTLWENWPMLESMPLGIAIRDFVKTKKTRVVNTMFPNPYGEWGSIQSWIGPWGDGFAVVSRNTTEQEMAISAVQEAEIRFQLITEATKDVIFDWDLEEKEIIVSTANAGEFLDTTDAITKVSFDWWVEQIHEEDRERIEKSLAETLSSKDPSWDATYRLRKLDGSYADVLAQCFILRLDGTPLRLLGAIVDLTRLREAEKKVEELRSDLIHISRVSAMGTMASTLAHELNQPLAAVTNYLSGVQKMLANEVCNEDVREAVSSARDAAIRAGDIIKRLRCMVTKGDHKREMVHIDSVINEALSLVMAGLGVSTGIQIEQEIESGLFVEGDPVQLQQVVHNLVRNAVEAMTSSPRKRLRIKAFADGETVKLEIRDTGDGMTAEIRRNLWVPFSSAKREGMGMGLPISRTIIESHNGRISVGRSNSRGTIFVIELPRAGR